MIGLTHIDEATIVVECAKVRSRQGEECVKLWQEGLHVWM